MAKPWNQSEADALCEALSGQLFRELDGRDGWTGSEAMDVAEEIARAAADASRRAEERAGRAAGTLWGAEHGAGYDVPEAVTSLVLSGEAEDTSWHNDTCPSFTWPAKADGDALPAVVLWVEHPNPERREYEGGRRFAVHIHTEDRGEARVIHETDDAEDAARLFRVAVAELRGAQAGEVRP